jgi:hypothetical protein
VRLSRVHPIPSPASAAEVYAIRLLSLSRAHRREYFAAADKEKPRKAIFFLKNENQLNERGREAAATLKASTSISLHGEL